jgi:hypothetical protein
LEVEIVIRKPLKEALEMLREKHWNYHQHVDRCGGDDSSTHESRAIKVRPEVIELQRAVLKAFQLVRTPITTKIFNLYFNKQISYEEFVKLMDEHADQQNTPDYIRNLYIKLIEKMEIYDYLPQNEGVVFLEKELDW